MQAKGEQNNGHLVDWHAKACQVLTQPMAVTSPQEESQSGTRARHAAAGPDAGRPTAFPDESLRSEPEERPGDTAGTCGERKP